MWLLLDTDALQPNVNNETIPAHIFIDGYLGLEQFYGGCFDHIKFSVINLSVLCVAYKNCEEKGVAA